MDKQKDLVKPKGTYRYRILALLFMATTINYMDRSIFGVLGPTLQNEVFHWSDWEYGKINAAFKIAYAIGMVSMGAIIDKFGTRLGYTLSIAIWSISGAMHALVRPAYGLIGFMMARAGLAFGEAGNFPAAIKTVAEWFPKRERAFATGIFNAGSNIGAVLAPAIIPFIVLRDGTNWQYAFLTTGALSALWVFLWLRTYRKPEDHKKVSPEELNYINSDTVAEEDAPLEPKEKLGWSALLPVKETWAFGIGKLTDAVWWFYLFWGGKFFADTYDLEIHQLGLPLIIIFLIADGGSIAGGWISGFFMNKGWSVNKARKITLLICGLAILPVMFATFTHNKWLAVGLIALAAGGHQAWSANLFTFVSDIFPKKATASVTGIGGMMGALAGFVADLSLGGVLENSGKEGYFFAFLISGSLYLFILLIMHLITPKLHPLDENMKKAKLNPNA